MSRTVVALESRLKGCANVITLGIRPNFSDYGPEEAEMIRKADTIYYPATFYADLLDAMGKRTFPSYHTYKCVMDKIKQTALLDLMGLPHPRTRAYYGRRWLANAATDFSYPFIAKIPRGSAMGRGVFLIQNEADLRAYAQKCPSAAYIQERLDIDRDIRVVIIGREIVLAYWRVAPKGDFRSNIAVGGRVSLDPVPQAALDLALDCARSCRWDDVGIDICCCSGRYLILEANMKYGKEGFRTAGIDYLNLMERLIGDGKI
jgi:ribosomal protein S6--L-glutamate ligase